MNNTGKNSQPDLAAAVSVSCTSHAAIRAVKLKKTNTGFELIWKKITEDSVTDAENMFDQIVGPSQTYEQASVADTTVVSFDSAPVAFYRIEIPPVDDQQVDSIVEMQLDALLPVSPQQMQVAWQVHPVADGKRVVTVAAARTDRLKQALPTAKRLNSDAIFLSCQAVVRAWSELFQGQSQKALVIHRRKSDTQLLLVEDGRLLNNLTLDVDLTVVSDPQAFKADVELFAHDLRNSMLDMGLASDGLDICLLSSGDAGDDDLLDYLKATGINARISLPDPELLSTQTEMTAKDMYEYLEVIGAAMMALDNSRNAIDIFKDIYQPFNAKKTSVESMSLKRVSLLALVAFIVFLVVSKSLDKAELVKLQSADMTSLVARENMRKAIAQQRPDMLSIMTKINESKPQDMLIDSFSFKNNTVTIASSADSFEKIYQFQKDLESKAGFYNVKDQNPVRDEKTRKIAFKITFSCKPIAGRKLK